MRTGIVLVLVVFITLGMEMAYAKRPSTGQQRPGVCPKVPSGTAGICIQECSEDASCPPKMKCCSNGCGKTCQMPLFPKSGSGGRVNDGMNVY